MDEETWEDPGVAAVVGRLVVPVRVDADARPDVYARFHMGGLPTTALLTADGAFVRGATFLSSGELQRFLDLGLDEWRVGRLPAPRVTREPVAPANLVDAVVGRLVRRADLVHGGFGIAPKLPETEALTLLLRLWRRSKEPAIERIVRGSLDAVVAHLADPRDGGFFRYAAAMDWTSPHTEKLAVDQARIVRLLLEAGVALDAPRYVAAACAGLAHARRRLADEQGRVLSSVAADPEYYAADGRRGDATSAGGTFSGTDSESAQVSGGMAVAHRSSADDRSPTERPLVDTRRFADGAAAMTSAAAFARAITGNGFGFSSEFLDAAPSGAVTHRLDQPDTVVGLLQDHALALTAALDAYRLSGDVALVEWAERVARFANEHLWDDAVGAFRSEPRTAREAVGLPAMFPLLANGEMAHALVDLADHSGCAEYQRHARRAVESLAARATTSPAGAAIALTAFRLKAGAPEVDIDGDPTDPTTRALAHLAVATLGPVVTVRWTRRNAPGITVCVGDLCLPRTENRRDAIEALVKAGLVPQGILAHRSCSGPDEQGA